MIFGGRESSYYGEKKILYHDFLDNRNVDIMDFRE